MRRRSVKRDSRGPASLLLFGAGLNRAFFEMTPEQSAKLAEQRRVGRLERLIDLTRGHGSMCPCDACKELRTM